MGIPYQWAQWLAGLQFLNTAEGQPKVEASLSAGYMEETILRIRKRVKARQALNLQLATLGGLIWLLQDNQFFFFVILHDFFHLAQF